MSTKRTTARIATMAATASAAAVLVGGTALAAGLGSDVGVPVPAVDQHVTPAIELPGSPSPSPSPSSDPASTVTSTVNGLVETAKNTLGLGPSPTASPSPSATATARPDSGQAPHLQPRPTTGTAPAPRPALPHTGGSGVATTSGSLSSFGAGLADRRPALANLAPPVAESVRGVGTVAAPTLSRSVSDALPGDGSEPNPLPGLLVVAAAACVAAVAAGNAEVWRRRLAEQLG